jgi:plastocyanin
MRQPAGYGYDPGASPWAVLYMVMNHKPAPETDAYVRYTMKIDDDPSIQSVVPFWLDVNNCRADPIYNIKGDGKPGSKSVRSRDFYLDPNRLGASGGRIVAGAGHVHGGAYRLELHQPACSDRELFRSTPTWGNPDHPFYNVLPVLHEPGPINMTAFRTPTGFPVEAGQYLRLNSVYDDSQPHTRVMGIMIVYVAPDPAVPNTTDPCGALPGDLETLGANEPGRLEPVPFTVPLTGLDDTGTAVTINKPPGETKGMKSGSTVGVRDNYFKTRNIKIERGAKLSWAFDTSGLHNLTLANGPEAIGSPNLSRDGGGAPRVFTKRFRRPGTYRLFCALHPVQMTERVIVKK